MKKHLTVADIPKKYLIQIVKETKIYFSECAIARMVLHDRIKQASAFYIRLEKKVAAATKIRSPKRRLAVDEELSRMEDKFVLLVKSNEAFARQYGLYDEYFNNPKRGGRCREHRPLEKE